MVLKSEGILGVAPLGVPLVAQHVFDRHKKWAHSAPSVLPGTANDRKRPQGYTKKCKHTHTHTFLHKIAPIIPVRRTARSTYNKTPTASLAHAALGLHAAKKRSDNLPQATAAHSAKPCKSISHFLLHVSMPCEVSSTVTHRYLTRIWYYIYNINIYIYT